MDETLKAVNESVISGLGQLTDFFGFSPVMGHLYGALLMSPTPLSLDKLEEVIGKSKASVSMYMRAVWVKGDRRKYYEAESDLWKIITTILESRERREVGVALQVLDENVRRLEEARPMLSENDRALAEYYLGRVNDLRMFFRFAQLALEMIIQRDKPPDLDDISKIQIPD
jgi:DNA-binding transcriptional regulator GbsR (MarR family)